MRPLLLDADAFVFLRKLSIGSSSLLEAILRRARKTGRQFYLTEFVAWHDLVDLQREIIAMEAAGLLEIKTLASTDRTYKKLRQQIDKGEAEAIAWSLTQNEPPLFVARDFKALACAIENGIPATDLMGLFVEMVESGTITKDEAKRAADPWNDPVQQLGKPKNYKGFDATFARCGLRGPYYYP
ncbi:MAG: hypothetical protein ACYDC3_00940 [Candidatus Binataceae bacterium]